MPRWSGWILNDCYLSRIQFKCKTVTTSKTSADCHPFFLATRHSPSARSAESSSGGCSRQLLSSGRDISGGSQSLARLAASSQAPPGHHQSLSSQAVNLVLFVRHCHFSITERNKTNDVRETSAAPPDRPEYDWPSSICVDRPFIRQPLISHRRVTMSVVNRPASSQLLAGQTGDNRGRPTPADPRTPASPGMGCDAAKQEPPDGSGLGEDRGQAGGRLPLDGGRRAARGGSLPTPAPSCPMTSDSPATPTFLPPVLPLSAPSTLPFGPCEGSSFAAATGSFGV